MVAAEETKQKDNAENLAKLYKAIEMVEEKESCLVKNYDAEYDSAQKHIEENNRSDHSRAGEKLDHELTCALIVHLDQSYTKAQLEQQHVIVLYNLGLLENQHHWMSLALSLRAARQCLRRKCCYEQLIEKTGEYHSRLQDVMIMLDDSLTKRPGYIAFISGRCYRRTMNTNSAEHQINEIIAGLEDMKQIEVAISDSVDTTPIGALSNHDEEDIEFELGMIEEELRRLAATATVCPRSA